MIKYRLVYLVNGIHRRAQINAETDDAAWEQLCRDYQENYERYGFREGDLIKLELSGFAEPRDIIAGERP